MNKNDSYTIFINKISGFVLNQGEDSIRALIHESNLPVNSIEFLEPQSLIKTLDTLDETSHPILIGGGDGTIRFCVSALKDKDISFGILPMGTMNLLAQDIGLPNQLKEALIVYEGNTAEHNIDVGVVNEEYFLCCAGIGIMPEASSYREKLRKSNNLTLYPKLTAFILERMNTDNYSTMQIEIPPHKFSVRTASLVVSNNQFTATPQIKDNQFKKDSLQDGNLGIYVLKSKGWIDRLRFFLRLGIGGWKSDPIVKEWISPQVTISTDEQTIPVSLDGEPVEMKSPLNFSIKPLALRLRVPGTQKKEQAR